MDNPISNADPEGDCPWCVVAGVVWAAYEVGSQIYDTYDAYKTVTNPEASTGAKVASVAGVIVDVVAPGGGYGHIGKEAVEQVTKHGDDVVDSVKTGAEIVDKAKPVEIKISKSKYPEAAKHIEEATKNGHPSTGKIDRAGAANRRKESLKNTPTVKGKDRDEFPPAVLNTGGKGASVKTIKPSDNRGAGSSMGNQMKKLPNGTEVKIIVDK